MVKVGRGGLVLAGLALLLGAALWVGSWRPIVSGIVTTPTLPQDLEAEWPRIDLARMDRKPQPPPDAKRDIFSATSPRRSANAIPTPPPPPTTLQAALPPPSAAPAPAPITLRFVGTIKEEKRGILLAVLLTDRKEILTGQAGELVANRFRIVRIGFDSVEIQDVGSDSVRRIPLRGN